MTKNRESQSRVQQSLLKERQKLSVPIKPKFPNNITTDVNQQQVLTTLDLDLQSIFNELIPKIKAAQSQLEQLIKKNPGSEELQTSKLQIETQVRAINALKRDVEAFKEGKNVDFDSKQIRKKIGYIRKTFDSAFEAITKLNPTSPKPEAATTTIITQSEGETLSPPPAPPMGNDEIIYQPEDYLATFKRDKSTTTATQAAHSTTQSKEITQKKYALKVLANETARNTDRLDEINSKITPVYQALNAITNQLKDVALDKPVKDEIDKLSPKTTELKERIDTFLLLTRTIQDSSKEWPDHNHPDYKKFQENIATLTAKSKDGDEVASQYLFFVNSNYNYLNVNARINELRKLLEIDVDTWLKPLEKEYGDALKNSTQLLHSIKEKFNLSTEESFAPPPPAPDLDEAPQETKKTITPKKRSRQTATSNKNIDFNDMAIAGVQKLRRDVDHFYQQNSDFLKIKQDLESIISKCLNEMTLDEKIQAHLREILTFGKEKIKQIEDLHDKLNQHQDTDLVKESSQLKDQYYAIIEWSKKTKKILDNVQPYIKDYEKAINKEAEERARIEMSHTLSSIQWELMKLIDSKEKEYRTSHSDPPQKDSQIKELYNDLENVNSLSDRLNAKKMGTRQVEKELELSDTLTTLLHKVKPAAADSTHVLDSQQSSRMKT